MSEQAPAAILLDRSSAISDNMDMSTMETVQFQATPEFHRQLNAEAQLLNLSLSVYIQYLHARMSPGRDPARLDRHVREVFGKHGELTRRLAK